MTVTINLPPEKEAVFKAQAQARGLSVAEWLLLLAEHAAGERIPAHEKFDNLADLLLNSPFAEANLNLERSDDYPRPVDIK